jgi:predicted dehydrogenase
MRPSLLKVAVIGTGMIANTAHIPAFQNLAGEVELAAVVNPNRASAEETARQHAIPGSYTSVDEMLQAVRPDIVAVTTPNVYHHAGVMAALHSGAHVFCEKPVAVTAAEAEEMFAAASQAGRILYVAQTARYAPDVQAARAIIESGRLGQVYFVETSAVRRRGIPTWGRFHMRTHNAGGPLYDLGVHLIDMIFWLLGSPAVKSVSGMTYTRLGNQPDALPLSLAKSGAPAGASPSRAYDYREFDVEDLATGYIRLVNGATILLRTSWALNLPESSSTLLAGERAGMQVSPLKIYENIGRMQSDTQVQVPPDASIPFVGHWHAARNLVQAIRGQAEVLVKPEEVLNVIRTVEGLYRSAERQQEVAL